MDRTSLIVLIGIKPGRPVQTGSGCDPLFQAGHSVSECPGLHKKTVLLNFNKVIIRSSYSSMRPSVYTNKMGL